MELEEMTVKIRLTEPMLGTVTKDPELYKTYIESKKPEDIQEDESKTVEKIEEKGWTGFHVDDTGLFIYDYMIKGFLKNAGNILKGQVAGKGAKGKGEKETRGMKNLRSKIDNQLFVFPRRIHFGKTQPDGILERPLRAMTMRGPRVTLARSDMVNAGIELDFTINWLKGGDISAKLIKSLLEYGQLCGLGQFRNGSYGRFEVVSAK